VIAHHLDVSLLTDQQQVFATVLYHKTVVVASPSPGMAVVEALVEDHGNTGIHFSDWLIKLQIRYMALVESWKTPKQTH
jgi:hypothetical protein